MNNPEQIKQSVDTFVAALTPAAEQLKIPIDQLWGWALKHNYATATSEMVMILLYFFLVGVYFNVIFKKALDNYERQIWPIAAIMGAVILFISFSFILFCVYDVSMRLVSPEWMTIKDLTNLVKE